MNRFFNQFKNATYIGMGLLLVYLILYYAVFQNTFNWDSFLKMAAVNFLFTYSLYFANSYTFDLVKQRLGLAWKKPIKVVFFGLLSSLIVSFFVGFLLSIAAAAIYGNSLELIEQWIFTADFYDLLERIIWISLTITFVFYFINYYQENKEKQIESKEVVIKKITTSNDALKSQIGPHFLFNSLNVLSGLTEENPKKAQDFIADLSMVYRYVLEQSNKDLTSIAEEIDFAMTYLQLVQTRFEDALEFEIQKELKDSQEQIVPLSLQLLLENCIKHNVVSKQRPLKIKIYKENNLLVVENNLQEKKQLLPSTKTGLSNIQSKYQLLSKQTVNIEKTNQKFVVKLPILNPKKLEVQTINQNEYFLAKDRVKDIQGFYSHASVYIIMNLILNSIDYFRDYQFNWAFYTSCFWGIGLSIHALVIFGVSPFGSNWKKRKIEQIILKNRKS